MEEVGGPRVCGRDRPATGGGGGGSQGLWEGQGEGGKGRNLRLVEWVGGRGGKGEGGLWGRIRD